MAQPVWVLSVDLQAKTATFASGMADAARSARGSFNDIKAGAADAGGSVGYSMKEARHGLMLLGEEFGVHIPRGVTSFLASLGPVGAAMEAAFPFLAIAVGATILLTHLAKLREEGEKLTESQIKFGTAAANALGTLEEKLLQAGVRADELNGNHLGALKKQLELIDKQSMSELVHQFDLVAKAADVVFSNLKGHWYSIGIGSDGAKHALDDFKTKYENLLARGKDKDASDLLASTRASAEHTLAMMEQLKSSRANPAHGVAGDSKKYAEARAELEKTGLFSKLIHDTTEEEVQSVRALVDTLKTQSEIEENVAKLRKAEHGNASTAAGKEVASDAAAALKAQMDNDRREQDYENKRADERRKEAVDNLQQTEKLKLDATERGTEERLRAIDEALKEEEKYGLQETAFYKNLASQKVEVERDLAEQRRKLRSEMERDQAEHDRRMAELELAGDRQHQQLMAQLFDLSAKSREQQELLLEDRAYKIKQEAYKKELAALDKHAADYLKKKKGLEDKEEEAEREHQNKISEIKDRAQVESAETWKRFGEDSADMLKQAALFEKSWSSAFKAIGAELLQVIAKMTILRWLQQEMSGKEGGGAVMSFVSGFFGGGFSMHASGGRIGAGEFGIAGEAGAELLYGGSHGIDVITQQQFTQASSRSSGDTYSIGHMDLRGSNLTPQQLEVALTRAMAAARRGAQVDAYERAVRS